MPDDNALLCYHAVVSSDGDGLAHGDGHVMAVGYRANPDTDMGQRLPVGRVGDDAGGGAGGTGTGAQGRYGQPAEARRVRYESGV